jgi:hypothetical protein
VKVVRLTDIPRVKERKERGDRKNVIELRERRHLESLVLSKVTEDLLEWSSAA